MWKLGIGDGARPAAMELYFRIEAARLDVRALRLGRRRQAIDNIDSKMERTAAMETQWYGGLLDALREVPSPRKRLEERLEFWRLPARGRHKCPVEKGALAVAQGAPI